MHASSTVGLSVETVGAKVTNLAPASEILKGAEISRPRKLDNREMTVIDAPNESCRNRNAVGGPSSLAVLHPLPATGPSREATRILFLIASSSK